MVSTPSTRLGFELQGHNDNTGTWDSNLNTGTLQPIDDAFAKEVIVSTTGGDTALSVNSYAADESRCPIIRIGVGQTLLSAVRITTARARIYFVTNETASGSFAVSFGGNVSNVVALTRATGAYVRVRNDGTTSFASPMINLVTGAIDGASLASGTFLLGSNNLSDVASPSSARTNLGLGALAVLSSVTASQISDASANGRSLITAADYAAMRILLGLVIGTNVQAYDADLTTWAGLTPSANAQSLVTAADYAAMRALLSLVYATQTDQETGTSTTTVVSPGTQRHHPSHPKAQGNSNSSGTLIGISPGVSSCSRLSTGLYEITLASAMADTNYQVQATIQGVGGASIALQVEIRSSSVFRVRPILTSGSAVDAGFAFVVYGDMP